MDKRNVTVIEHPNYLKKAKTVLTSEQIDEIANTLAANPKAGNVIGGTGGFKEWRHTTVREKSESGMIKMIHLEIRMIHLFVVNNQEIHLVDIYGKGKKNNLTKPEKNELAKLSVILKGKETRREQ